MKKKNFFTQAESEYPRNLQIQSNFALYIESAQSEKAMKNGQHLEKCPLKETVTWSHFI